MTEEVAACLAPGMHGCTFGGNPVCSAAASWALAKVTAPGFLEQVRRAAATLAAEARNPGFVVENPRNALVYAAGETPIEAAAVRVV